MLAKMTMPCRPFKFPWKGAENEGQWEPNSLANALILLARIAMYGGLCFYKLCPKE